jgi:uncharacterized membrane protein YhaH (DUF805 family)
MHWILLPMKRYAEFSGRSRRKEYWLFFLGVLLLYLALFALMIVLLGGAVLSAIQGNGSSASMGPVLGQSLMGIGVIALIVLLWWALLIPSLAVGVRRLHDIDRSGWWLMLGYGPWIAGEIIASAAQSETLAAIFSLGSLIGFLVLLVFAVLPGTPGPNRFGPDPKGEDLDQVFA